MKGLSVKTPSIFSGCPNFPRAAASLFFSGFGGWLGWSLAGIAWLVSNAGFAACRKQKTKGSDMLGLPDKNTEIQGMVDLGLHGRRMAKKNEWHFAFFVWLFLLWWFLGVLQKFRKEWNNRFAMQVKTMIFFVECLKQFFCFWDWCFLLATLALNFVLFPSFCVSVFCCFFAGWLITAVSCLVSVFCVRS